MKKEKLKIIYEDKYIIVINKNAGVLTISNAYEKEKTLYHQVSLYLKKQNKNNKVFIVHRLDKDTSGLVIFAKSPKIKKILQDNWDIVIRKYIAVVNGVVKKDKDIIKNYLNETKTHLVYVTKNKKGKEAITEYEKLATNTLYSLLKINIKTGRHHQIRVHLNNINHPIVGDKIYNKTKNNNVKRLYLHASYIEFRHPVNNEIIKLSTSYPKEFTKLIDYKKDIVY